MKKQKLHFSRLLSLALSLALLCTALSVPFSVSANDEGTATGLGTSATDPWNGTTISTSLEGTGSIGNPYKINNAADLAFLATKGATLWGNTPIDCIEVQGKYFELTADIYLNDVSNEWYKDPTGAEGLREWKNTSTCKYTSGGEEKTKTPLFTGKLNGNNHKIYGLYMNDADATHGGLFSQVSYGAVIENLGIEKSYIAVSTSSGSAGAFAGQRADENTTTVSIKNCYSSDTVTVKGQNAGGLLGKSYWKFSFTNCYSSATIDGIYKGGIVGQTEWNSAEGAFAFTNCYSTQAGLTITGGANNYPTYTNSYAINVAGKWDSTNNTWSVIYQPKLTLAQMTGDAAYTNMTGYDFNSVWHVFDGTPKLRAFGVSLEPEIWDGSLSKTLQGEGTSGNPYLIYSAADLALFASESRSSKFTKLMADIYLNDVSSAEWYNGENLNPWTPGKAPGNFDGNGHVIHGIYINSDVSGAQLGLFGKIGTAKFSNLGIEDSYISGNASESMVGALWGFTEWTGGTTVNNCYVSDTVILKGKNVGGFLGYMNDFPITFNNCYSSAVVTGTISGELVGDGAAQLTVNNCYSTGSTDLVRYNYGKTTFTNCYAATVWYLKGKDGVTQLNAEQMLGDGMTALATATDTNGEKIWFTNPKSTPKLAAFPIDGDVNGDKKVDICDLVLAKQVSLGSVTYKDINFATTNLDNSDELYTINELDINKIRAGKLLGLDF